jgi:type II secretory pathway component GspD/PulD (secretin)
MPLPHLRVREVVATGQLKPGETLVLRGPLTEEKLKMKDKVPVLGDIPLVGALFRSESSETRHKRLYIFITPAK